MLRKKFPTVDKNKGKCAVIFKRLMINVIDPTSLARSIYFQHKSFFFESWVLTLEDDVHGFMLVPQTMNLNILTGLRCLFKKHPKVASLVYYRQQNDISQNADKEYLFFINIYLEIFFFIQLSKNPQGLPATYSDLDTIACVKSSLKKLTTKEKLWHASENGCMVCRDHKLTNGTRGYIAKSLRESPQREFLYKLMLRLSIP